MLCSGMFVYAQLVIFLTAVQWRSAASEFRSARLHPRQATSLPSCGVLHNYTENLLLLNGFVKCYDEPYSLAMTSFNISLCAGTQNVFFGAKRSSSSTNFELGAFGPSTILAQNYSMTMYAAQLEVGGAYWYHNSSYCIGFASTANITLDTCDIDSTDCADRLSWYLDNSKGGYRAGCETLLDFNSSWRKVIYKGNSLISCTQDPLSIQGATQYFEQDSITLGCLYAGSISHGLIWLRRNVISNGTHITTMTGSHYTIATNYTMQGYTSTLTVLNATAMDSGDYVCEIINDIPSFPPYVSVLSVTVIGRNRCNESLNGSSCQNAGVCINAYQGIFCQCIGCNTGSKCDIVPAVAVTQKPIITKNPVSVSAQLYQDITLSCEAQGCPTPTYSWYKDGVLVSHLPYVIISGVEPEDRGSYICVASNTEGNATSQPAYVTIEGVYSYSAIISSNISFALQEILFRLTGSTYLNSMTKIVSVNAVAYKDHTSIIFTVSSQANSSVAYNSIQATLSSISALMSLQIMAIQRYDGCESNQTNVTLNETTSAYTWPETDIGNLLSPCACIKRRCGGSYTYGAMWRDVENDCYNISASNVLFSICAAGLDNSTTPESFTSLLTASTSHTNTLNTEDVNFAVGAIEQLTNQTLSDSKLANGYLQIINNIMRVNLTTLIQGQLIYNTSSRLLGAIQAFVDNFQLKNESQVAFNQQSFSLFIQDIDQQYFQGEVFNAILNSMQDLVTGNMTTYPDGLVTKTNSTNNAAAYIQVPATISQVSTRLSFGIFVQSTFFQSLQVLTNAILNPLVLSVRINSTTTELFNSTLDVTFHVNESSLTSSGVACASWNSTTAMWSSKGCILVRSSGSVQCQCKELNTYFGFIFGQTIQSNRVNENQGAVNITEFASMQLVCTYNGLQAYPISWLKRNVFADEIHVLGLSGNIPRHTISEHNSLKGLYTKVENTLTIINATSADSGDYLCVLNDGTATVSSQYGTITVIVTDKNWCTESTTENVCMNGGTCIDSYINFYCQCTGCYVGPTCSLASASEDRWKPVITQNPVSVSAQLYQGITLSCEAQGCPTPTYSWYKDGVLVSHLPYVIISGVEPEDRGSYICVASNTEGNVTSQPAYVTIKGIYTYVASISNGNILQEVLIRITATVEQNTVVKIQSASSGSVAGIMVTVSSNANTSTIYDSIVTIFSNIATQLSLQITAIKRYDGCRADQTIITINNVTAIYTWPETSIATVSLLCTCITRRCGGSYLYGAMWENVTDVCLQSASALQLFICEQSLTNQTTLAALAAQVAFFTSQSNLTVEDVILAVNLVEQLTIQSISDAKTATYYLQIIDNVIRSGLNVLLLSQQKDSTSYKILNALQIFSDNFQLQNGSQAVFTEKSFGLFIQDIDPRLFQGETFNALLGSVYDVSRSNMSIDPADLITTMKAATNATAYVQVPAEAIESSSQNLTRISFGVFVLSSLFQSYSLEATNLTLAPLVLYVGINSSSATSNTTIDLSFKNSLETNDASCNSFNTTSGKWSNRGCVVVSKGEGKVQCKCETQKANFGLLFNLNPIPINCPGADIVTYIGLAVSVPSLVIFLVMFLASRKLRTSEHGQILINLSTALLGLYITFLLSSGVTSVTVLCGMSSGLLQYFMLVFFAWTAVEAVHLYIKLVKVLGTNINHFTLISGLLAWLLPLVVVIISGGAGYRSYASSFFCRPTSYPFYFGLVFPFAVINCFNWIMFVIILISICRHTKQNDNAFITLRQNMVRAACLATVFGLVWGFGLTATSYNVEAATCAIEYIFSILIGTQGLLVFVLHGIRNADAIKVWKSLFTKSLELYKAATLPTYDVNTLNRTTEFFTKSELPVQTKFCDLNTLSRNTEERYQVAIETENKNEKGNVKPKLCDQDMLAQELPKEAECTLSDIFSKNNENEAEFREIAITKDNSVHTVDANEIDLAEPKFLVCAVVCETETLPKTIQCEAVQISKENMDVSELAKLEVPIPVLSNLCTPPKPIACNTAHTATETKVGSTMFEVSLPLTLATDSINLQAPSTEKITDPIKEDLTAPIISHDSAIENGMFTICIETKHSHKVIVADDSSASFKVQYRK